MRMRKLLKVATALSLSLILLAGCSKPASKKADDPTDGSGSDSSTEENIDGNKKDIKSTSDTDVTKEDYNGLWCHKSGPYVDIDVKEGTMKFITGEDYKIDEISSDHITVHWNGFDKTEYESEQFMDKEPFQKKMRCTYVSASNCNPYYGPLSRQGQLNIPAVFTDGKLYLFEEELIPEDEFASSLPSTVEKLLCKAQFQDLYFASYSYYGDEVVPKFKETGYCSFEPLFSGELTYEVDGMTVTLTDTAVKETVEFYVLYKCDTVILISEYGGTWYEDDDVWAGEYIDVITDEVWTVSNDGYLVIEFNDGFIKEFEKQYMFGGLYYIAETDHFKYDVYLKPHTYGCFYGNIFESGNASPITANLAFEGTFEYTVLQYRNEIRNGDRKNDVYTSEQIIWKNDEDPNETITCDVDIQGYDINEVWLPDYCSISIQPTEKEEMWYSYNEVCLSPNIYVIKGPYYSGVSITVTEKVDEDYEEENIGVRLFDDADFDSKGTIDSCSISDKNVTATFTPKSNADVFYAYLTEESVSNNVDRQFDVKSMLGDDPHDSPWAINNWYAEDIIDLVDMEYFSSDKCYIDPMTGSAVFYVFTVEDFACVTYYINAVDIDPNLINDYSIEVHLMNDIDLDGYEWTPIGDPFPMHTSDGFYMHDFRGIFYGNGYSIKNYYTSNGGQFFDSADDFTIIGLTLENPVMDGINHVVVIGGGFEMDMFISSSCSYGNCYDCHLKIRSEDYTNGTEDLCFCDSNDPFLGIVDCTMTIDGKDCPIAKNGSVSDFRNDKEIIEPLVSTGTYKYNAQADYQAFKEEHGY